jgi:ABC-type transporter MlaC component
VQEILLEDRHGEPLTREPKWGEPTMLAKRLGVLAIAASILAVTSFAPPVKAANCPAADTVRKAARAFMAAARDGSKSAFASVLSRYTNVEALATFALGKYRAKLPAARRAEYVRNAYNYMSQALADNARSVEGRSDLQIESCRGHLVETSFSGGSGMVWRVSGGQVEDVRVSGVWLALQLRQKFTGIIRQNHDDVRSLLDFLARETTRQSR